MVSFLELKISWKSNSGFFRKVVETTQDQIRETLAELCGSEINDNRPVKPKNNAKHGNKRKRLEINDSDNVESKQRRLSAALEIAQKEHRYLVS